MGETGIANQLLVTVNSPSRRIHHPMNRRSISRIRHSTERSLRHPLVWLLCFINFQPRGHRTKTSSNPPQSNLSLDIRRKPRNLGFQRNFPFQLENARGKRLAFVDVENIRIVDPIAFKDQKVNVLGKLEAVEKGSNELVIRARLVRRID